MRFAIGVAFSEGISYIIEQLLVKIQNNIFNISSKYMIIKFLKNSVYVKSKQDTLCVHM